MTNFAARTRNRHVRAAKLEDEIDVSISCAHVDFISDYSFPLVRAQLSELLAEKETVLSEALKRQGQLIENIEELEAEKKKYQREAERLKLQNDRNTATLREMQGSIEEQADAMAFSEKMLSLSREQTESLHAMRESLRDKEEVVAQKVGHVSNDHPFPMKMPKQLRAKPPSAREFHLSRVQHRVLDYAQVYRGHGQESRGPLSHHETSKP